MTLKRFKKNKDKIRQKRLLENSNYNQQVGTINSALSKMVSVFHKDTNPYARVSATPTAKNIPSTFKVLINLH